MKYLLLISVFLFCSCVNNTIDKETTIGILPYKGINQRKVVILQKTIEGYYGVKVKILEPKPLPKNAFINIKSPRYRADSLIRIQERIIPNGIDYILGLTESDISTTKREKDGSIKKPISRYRDFGIMGLAYRPGNSCIVSDFRLKHKNKEIHFGRFKKVVIHELGHNFGLPHCPDKKCVMTDAVESVKTIDNAKPDLCIVCKNKLK